RERLRIAHRHAEPEGWMELEVKGIGGGLRRIARQGQLILHPVPGTRLVGVEEHRGLVMADIDPLTEHLFRILHLGTGDSALRAVERHMGRRGGGRRNGTEKRTGEGGNRSEAPPRSQPFHFPLLNRALPVPFSGQYPSRYRKS